MLLLNNSIGLFVQKAGYGIAEVGDKIHIAKTPFKFLLALFRPLLLNIFGIEKLKAFKKGMNK